jgi:hypothetical protein
MQGGAGQSAKEDADAVQPTYFIPAQDSRDPLSILIAANHSPCDVNAVLSEIQGFSGDYSVSLRQLLEEQWQRKFLPRLAQTLFELMENVGEENTGLSEANKAVLRQKYIAGNPCLFRLSDADPDYDLHLGYVQPWLWYGLDRKYEPGSLDTWIIGIASVEGAMMTYYNIALYFRAYMRAYIGAILQRTTQSADAPKLRFTDIPFPAIAALKVEKEKYFLPGRPQGWVPLVHEEDLPWKEDINRLIGQYAIGRLCFGQTREEVHHITAKQYTSTTRDYCVYWLYLHLKLHVMKAWLMGICVFFGSQWILLKQYIRGDIHFLVFVKSGFSFVLAAMLLFVFLPFLLLVPLFCGITTIPFTLLRSLLLYGKVPILSHYFVLKCLDILETFKDLFFIFWIGMPIVTVVASMMIAWVPTWLLWMSSILIFCILPVMEIFVRAITWNYYSFVTTHVMRYVGLLTGAFFAVYIALGVCGRYLRSFLPDVLQRVIIEGIWIVEKAAGYIIALCQSWLPSERLPYGEEESVSQLNARSVVEESTFLWVKNNEPEEENEEKTSLMSALMALRGRCFTPGLIADLTQRHRAVVIIEELWKKVRETTDSDDLKKEEDKMITLIEQYPALKQL